MPISFKLFLHINNDHAIQGTGFEGNTVADSCNFIAALYSKLQQADPKAYAILSPFIDNLKLIGSRSAIGQQAQEIQRALTNRRSEKDSIAFQAGWMGTDEYPGHAIIAQIKYDEEKNLILTLHNAGAGLEFHASEIEWNKTLSATGKIFKIPAKVQGSPHINWS